MRDPKRIAPLLAKVREVWEKMPDLRLCQLIGNCFPAGDLYYREDDELLHALEATYGK
jgi:Ni,Fe-hydrogenase III small subunit